MRNGIIIISFCFALLLGGCGPQTAENLPREEVERLVLQQLSAWETGSEADFHASLSRDAIFAYPSARLDFEGALEVFHFWKENFKDTKIYHINLIVEGNRFAVEYQFATTRLSNGKRSAAGTLTIGEVENGQITVWKEYLDGRVSRQQEAGELPVDEGNIPFPWPEPPS